MGTKKDETEQNIKQLFRWTKHIKSIFDKQYIIIPKCDHMHWELIIICFPGKIIKKYLQQEQEENEEEKLKKPCIAILDSMLGTSKQTDFALIRKWLNLEAQKYIKSMDIKDENKNNEEK